MDHPALSEALVDLESVYREHHRRVRWVLRARGVHEDALDDLAHDVFLTIHRRLPERDPAVPMGAWVAGIARNVAFSHRRAGARRLRLLRGVTEPEPVATLDEELAQRDAWAALRAFLEELDPGQREVLVLADLLGMRMPEIADTTAVPLNTLYSRLRLARARLQRRFADAPEGLPAFLGRAGRQEQPSPDRRRRAWVLLAAEVGRGGWVPLLGIGGKLAMGLSITIAIGVTAVTARGDGASLARVAQVEPERSAAPPSADAAPEISAAAPEPAVVAPEIASPEVVAVVATDRPRTVAVRKTAAAREADELAWVVDTLSSIKVALADGHPERALAEIAVDRDRLARSELRREFLRLELQAACAAGRTEIAHRAARGLGPAGEPGDDPCARR